ncbi:hypothetical protein [Phenylobacterium sp.]|uniref:hypothetical protein n=1 Tax=Phenylobacterium sp. TaxID=1871053 RepID=UPI0030F431EC
MTPDTDHHISVVPVEGGWRVLSPFDDTPLMFLSGAKAEEKAKALAERLAATGHDARVLIHDRTQALIGTWRYFADDAPMAELPVRAAD